MTWTVIFTQDFYLWYHEQPARLKKRLTATLINPDVSIFILT